MVCSRAGREMILNPHDNKDMGPVLTYILLQKQVIIGAGHPHWHWWQWKHLQIATMLDTDLEGDDTEPTTRIWACIRVWIPLSPSPYHTHTYDNIRIISTIAFCVLLSSFSSFLAISRLRSLNKKQYSNITFQIPEQEARRSHLLITYDMQRQKGKAWSILHSITISSKVFDTLSDQILDGGKACFHFLISCSMQKRSFSLHFCKLQAIKNWSRGRPGNETRKSNYHLQNYNYLAIISSPYQSTFLGARFAKF